MRHLLIAIWAGIAVATVLAVTAATSAQSIVQSIKSAPIDDARAQSNGIRKLASRHLVLYTDLPSSPEIDRLPEIFDQAVPQWANYFDVDESKTASWKARAFLIGDRRRFDALGLMPLGNDKFINGISIGSDLWLYDQPTDYYRRHLLLHEGTHAFMVTFLGGCGPGWYMEGTAELMATHRLDDLRRLTLRIMPRERTEVPMLGRFKLIRDAVAEGRSLSFADVMQIDNREQLGNEAYAWCWAAAKFLDTHPRYRGRFQRLKKHVRDPEFNRIVRKEFDRDWSDLIAEWPAFVHSLDYGYDFERMAIKFRQGTRLTNGPRSVTIAADRGWQSSGVRLDAGKSYRVTASGRYQIASSDIDGVAETWPCEPGGVTIEYHDGKPLGMLLGAIVSRTAEASAAHATLADEFDIGLNATITPAANGTLYLRVNESPSQLTDNRGELAVTIEAVTVGPSSKNQGRNTNLR